MKAQSGIEHIFHLRYKTKLFAIRKEVIIGNTRDLAKKILKMNITEEEIRENNFYQPPDILLTRKIPNTIFDYRRKLIQIRNFSA
jgi:hypothetical protein